MPRGVHITNEELIAEIRSAAVKEELAIPLYDSHISAALFWSGLPTEVQAQVVAGLKVLTTESRGHVKILNRVVALVRADASSEKKRVGRGAKKA